MFRNIIRSSTRAFLRESRKTRGFRWLDALHGYVYLRWPYLYVGVGTGEHPLTRLLGPISALLWAKEPRRGNYEGARGTGMRNRTVPAPGTFADNYHGKVVSLSGATEILSVNRDIAGTFPEQVLPYSRARDIVLKNPEHIVALECPCRASRKHPCLPLDVCLIVGEPFASFMREHHPGRTRSITQAEAVEILRREDARGHVHHAFFKDAMFGRFYAICNCCSCCCGAMQAHRNGIPMLVSSGYICRLAPSACVGCAECTQFCQFSALRVYDGVNHVDDTACMGCGICVGRCRQHALTLVRDPSRGEPLSVCDLLADTGASGH